jgi:polar amino acid transport system substrate-binding protein
VTKPRCAQVAYSDPILFDGAAIVFSKGTVATPPTRIADIAKLGAALGVQQGGADLRAVLDAGVAQANVRQFTNDPAIIDGLLAKRIEFGVMSHTPLHELFRQRNIDMEVVYPVPDDPPKAAACAFRKQDTDLLDAYQQELAKLKASGEYLKIARQFGFDTTPEQMRITAEQACSTA